MNRQEFARGGRQNLKLPRLYSNLSGTKSIAKLRIGTSLYHLLAFRLFSGKQYQTFTATVLMEFSEILTQVFPKVWVKGNIMGHQRWHFVLLVSHGAHGNASI